MNIGENILFYRKKMQLSQEELAEKIGVTRQTISNWELEESFPDVKQLVKLAEVFNVSLDDLVKLVNNEIENVVKNEVNREITIVSKTENVIVHCNKVQATQQFNKGKKSPQYALFSVGNEFSDNIFLGWYRNKNEISEEIEEIAKAIASKQTIYELKYSVEVDRKMLGMYLKVKNKY